MKAQFSQAILAFVCCMSLLGSLSGQINSTKNWPYDTITHFRQPDPNLEDSVIFNWQMAEIDGNGDLVREISFWDTAATDTNYIIHLFRNAQRKDTLLLQYRFDTLRNTRFLSRYQEATYGTDGLLDSIWVEVYSTLSPYDLVSVRSYHYDSLEREIACYRYAPQNGVLALEVYETRTYYDSSLIAQYRYFWDFAGSEPTPILLTETANYYGPNSELEYTLIRSRSLASDPVLQTDSIHHFFDAQGRRIERQQYGWNTAIQSWELDIRDTLQYDIPGYDLEEIQYVDSSGFMLPASRIRQWQIDSLEVVQRAEWERSTQSWWNSRQDTAITDQYGQQKLLKRYSYHSPGQLWSFLQVRKNYANGDGVYRYEEVLLQNFQYNIVSRRSSVYSLRTGTLSPIEPILSFMIQLYPNPTQGQVSIEYPLGQVGHVQILQANGQTVLQRALNASGRWQGDLSSLPAGLYFVRVQLDGKRLTRSLMLRK